MHQVPHTQTHKPSPTPRTNKALELLYGGVTKLMESDSWKRALQQRRVFHSYSFRNCWLIYLQRPDATLVAGYRKWQELGRQVKGGEKGIAILAPNLRRARNWDAGEETPQVIGFRTAYVYALEQTKGEPLAQAPRPRLLLEESTQIQETFRKLERYARSQGFAVERRELSGNALGRYTPGTRTITLKKDLPPLQELKTLLHELAHALMHDDISAANRHRLELEAESCAYLVCHALSLDTSAYSFAYLAGWAEAPEELLAVGEKAVRTADAILAVLGQGMPRECSTR